MKILEYKRLKKEAESQYEKALETAERERLESLAAIERVWVMMNPRRNKTISGTVSSSSQYGSLARTVRKALELVPQKFTKTNILAAMKQIAPDMESCNQNSLGGCLHRLKTNNIIRVVKKGQGRTPAEYELVKENETQETTEQQILLE